MVRFTGEGGAIRPRPTADELERMGEKIAELAAHLHAATYQLLVLLREYDALEGWAWGFRTCAEWLSWRTGIGPGAAREKVRVARALGELPVLSDAMRRGELSYSKARALTRVATPETEAELAEFARHATAAHVERLVRAWRGVDRAEEARLDEARHRSRSLSVRARDDGTWGVRGELDPEVGALLERAVMAAAHLLHREGRAGTEADGTTPSWGQKMADAIGLVAEAALQGGLDRVAAERMRDEGEKEEGEHAGEPGSGAEARGSRPAPATISRADRFQVVVHLSEEVLREAPAEGAGTLERGRGRIGPTLGGEFGDAVGVSAETSLRLACDASRVLMRHGKKDKKDCCDAAGWGPGGAEGPVLSVGRKTRVVPPHIRRALERRDGGCRFPGCGLRFCDAHHIVHWLLGGETRLDNLVMLCRRHHRAVHEAGYRIELESATGRVRVYTARGVLIPEAPPNRCVHGDPVRRVRGDNARYGLRIDADTIPCWGGDPFDLGYALDTLRPWEE